MSSGKIQTLKRKERKHYFLCKHKMNFISIKTYGRAKNRVIKTDLWISPEVRKDRLFASTSSESSVESTSSASVVNDEVKQSYDSLPR